MLNKRHCSPAKGLKSRRHCALKLAPRPRPRLRRSLRRCRHRRRSQKEGKRGRRSIARECQPTNTISAGKPLF